MKNFFIKKWSDLFIYLSKTVRERFENGSRMVRQMCAAWAMLWGKLVNCAKSLMQIFATYATFSSAIFVGKESCKSTVRYALWSRISLTKPLQNPYKTLTRFRLSLGSNLSRSRSACAPRTPSLFKDKSQLSFPSLASLICLCMLTVGVGDAWGAEVTFTPANCTDITSTEADQTQTISDVTISFHGVNNGSDLRTYKGKILTITAPSGYNITNIVITCSVSGTGKGGPGCFGTGAPSGYSYDEYIGTWTGSTASVSFTATDNQVRAESIVVTITASTTYSVTWKSDGVTVHTDAAVPSGTTVSTPSDPAVPSGCTGAKFMGWTATENYSHATDAPGDLFNGTSPTINSAKTYYAVFADPN